MNHEKNKKNHFVMVTVIVAIAVGILTLLAISLGQNPKDIESVLIGKKLPDFSVKLIQEPSLLEFKPKADITSADFKNKRLLINFWASWCVSCRHEARELEMIHRHFKDDLIVLGIAIQDTPEAALGFAKNFGKTYLLGLDETGNASIDYGVIGVPESFLVDKDGTIVHKIVGPVYAEEIKTLAKKYFNI